MTDLGPIKARLRLDHDADWCDSFYDEPCTCGADEHNRALAALVEEVEQLRAKESAALAVHSPFAANDETVWCNQCGAAWPCPTVAVLDPEGTDR